MIDETMFFRTVTDLAVAAPELPEGNQVARLYAAARNDVAYGASLRWADDEHLFVEFQEARVQTLDKPTVQIGGREVRVALRPNVSDPGAPAGGMLFNLERERQRRSQ